MDVQLVEVGPRDGLQNESAILDTSTKVALVRRLMDAGVTRIEVASFVHPGLVPQMADAEDVCAALPDSRDVSYIGVVLNSHGLDRALSTNVNEVNLVVAASEEFSQRNQGATLEEAILEVERMIPVARGADRFVTVTISVAFGCPFEGEVDPATVIRIAERAVAAGAQEVALGDTIGVAVPSDVSRIVPRLQDAIGDSVLRVHFHDTRRTGLGNVAEALRRAIDDIGIVIDSLDPETTDLSTSLGKLRARLDPLLGRNGIELNWDVEDILDADEFPPEVTLHILRIIQEAVTNSLQHSNAGRVEVSISVSGADERRCLRIRVADDGCALQTGPSLAGRGVKNMNSRAKELGAELRMEGTDSGTRIELAIPLRSSF